jgi:hypothetical protein
MGRHIYEETFTLNFTGLEPDAQVASALPELRTENLIP